MAQKQLDNLGVSAFCESMGMMIRSGIQTEEAVALLGENHSTGGVLESAIDTMKARLEEGGTLSGAMRETGIFPEYALQMIAAGEMSGRLEDVLFRLSGYYADQKTISEKLKSAVTYPAAMLILIIAVLAVMLTMVLPAFSDVYENLTGSISSSTYSYIHWAYAFCWIALVVMVVIAILLLGGLALWNNGKKKTVEGWLRKIPICRQILDNMGMFRFTSALGMFLASGEMQDIAVIDSIAMTDCAPVEEKLKRCVTRMEEGHSIAKAAYDEGIFEPVYGRMLLAGERSGNMESVLERLTHLLEENAGHLVDRLVGIVDPLLSGILMVTVGLSLLSVMLPLIGMMNAVG